MRFVLPLIAASLMASAASAAVNVPVNQALRVSLRGQAADVIVGNPQIADVNVLDGRTVYLVGKQTGITNLVILDGAGRTLFSDTVVVGNVGTGRNIDTVSIAQGRSVQDVTCSPVCASLPASTADATPAAAAAAAPAPTAADLPPPSSVASTPTTGSPR